MGDQRKVYLHVGTRKSGTSYLQDILRASEPALSADGLKLLYIRRPNQVQLELVPLQRYAETGAEEDRRAAVRPTRKRVARSGFERHLSTLEDLAELPGRAADALVGALAAHEVHVVITCRHWGKVIPSEWQQMVKGRGTLAYEDYLTQIAQDTEAGALFRARQDVPDIVRRWGRLIDPERVHVLVVPADRSSTGPGIVEQFCDTVGIVPETLAEGTGTHNASLGYPQAEVLRRLNVALGDRLPTVRGDYKEAVRRWVTRQVLMLMPRSGIGIPQAFHAWCREQGERQRAELLEMGVDIRGDVDDLVPHDLREEGLAVSEQELTDVAVRIVADLASRRPEELALHQEQLADALGERDRLAARVAELEAAALERRRR